MMADKAGVSVALALLQVSVCWECDNNGLSSCVGHSPVLSTHEFFYSFQLLLHNLIARVSLRSPTVFFRSFS